MAASKLVLEGSDIVFRLPVARLIELVNAGVGGEFEVVDEDAFVDDVIEMLNNEIERIPGGTTEIEQMFALEAEHVYDDGADSVRELGVIEPRGDDMLAQRS
ncbi:hypothetical protein [Bradyrhizobium sp. McL0616]|uniref:hypothetical protein n=1 Tax=Bradyrhizobium sp. McL0616 TaxID=3415674 RepID=UPI003CE89201